MNKETRILVFGIALMFSGVVMSLADGGLVTSLDSGGLGGPIFLFGLLIGAFGAFFIKGSEDVKTEPRAPEAPGTTSALPE